MTSPNPEPVRTISRARAVVVTMVLVFAFMVVAGFLGYELMQNQEWRMQIDALASYAGATRAKHDFQSGKLRLFVIDGERDDERYSGTNDGPFEVWHPQYFPGAYPSRYATEQTIKAYNEHMRFLREHSKNSFQPTNSPPRKD